MREKRRRGRTSGKKKLTVNYIREVENSEDYQIIADYLNKQDGNHPMTAEDVEERMKYFSHYTSLIKDDDQVIGLGDCYVSKLENLVYGENLLIAPAYQGFIYGGSFLFTILDALQNFFKKEAGISPRKMISSVQAGNQRAGKLYERLGYFDMAEWGNSIQNFIPFIFDYPFAKRFFDAQEVELVNCWKYYSPLYEDELTNKKIATYPYAFKTKNGFLRVILDGISERPLWVEDDQVLVACWIDEQQAYVGVGKEVNWLLQNRTEKPVEYSLQAIGKGGLHFELNQQFTLMPGERKRISKMILAEWVDDSDLNLIETEVLFNGQEVQLTNGYDLKELVHHKFERVLAKPFRKGQEYQRSFKIFNNYTESILGTAVIRDVKGLDLAGDREFSFEIGPRETKEVTLNFQTLDAGVAQIGMQLHLETRQAGTDESVTYEKEILIHVGVLELDGLLTWQAEDELTVVENENCALLMPNPNRDRNLYLFDKSRNERILKLPEEELGPKFIPEFVHTTKPQFSVVSNMVIETEGKVTLRSKMAHRYYQGIFMIREITMTRSNLLTLDYHLINQSQETFNLGIKKKFLNGWQGAQVAVPLEKGLVLQKSNGVDYPGTTYKVDFAENWTALEYDQKVLGIIWGDGRISYNKFNNLPHVDTGTFNLQPQDEVQVPSIYLYYGGGTHQEVQNLYQKTGYGKIKDLPTREVLDLNLEHRQLVISQPKTSFDLQVDRAIDFHESRWIQGDLQVSGPTDWKLTVMDGKLMVEVPKETKPGFYPLRIEFAAPTLKKVWPIQVFVTQMQGDVQVQEDGHGDIPEGEWEVGNGMIGYRVSTSFKERIVSLSKNDREYLCTTYPEPTAYHKEAPWFGGIGFTSVNNRWIRQQVDIAQQYVDESRWSGVGYQFSSAQNPGVTLLMEYLTTPGLPLVAIHGKVVNQSGKMFTDQLIIETNLNNLQEQEEIAGFIQENGKQVQFTFKPEKEQYYEILTQDWAIVETGTGEMVMMVNPETDHELGIKNWGLYGVHLTNHQSIALQDGEVREFTCYIIIDENITTLEQYKVLKPFVMRGEK